MLLYIRNYHSHFNAGRVSLMTRRRDEALSNIDIDAKRRASNAKERRSARDRERVGRVEMEEETSVANASILN